jgi:hypothetical protein
MGVRSFRLLRRGAWNSPADQRLWFLGALFQECATERHRRHRLQHLPASVSAIQVALMRSGKQLTTAQAAVKDGAAVFDDVGGLVTLQATIFEAEDGELKEKEFKLAIQRVSPLTSSLLPLVAADLPTRAVKSIVGRVAACARSSPGTFHGAGGAQQGVKDHREHPRQHGRLRPGTLRPRRVTVRTVRIALSDRIGYDRMTSARSDPIG